ncbi:putative methyltransferase YcgJ [Legionella massiliensis]|uniref:Putative methyltransferase YcgJ n=1 Tax=Legionella massiliensis TaxID=1034943 RepID=A0A078L1E2_9GAMM|nr:class I SAM-dependent methyltransferase [Legionella massiliensis]CDZ79011.1 putative methyltransferase YcgJ [Legionella massiliensis]CEE14749.1 putative methyltransferase YcgJ [Legionella massiliensis]
MAHKEEYDFEIDEEGLAYDILDLSFNTTTQAFLAKNGIKPGMRVLDVGSGSGIMTHYLAQQVGKDGEVLSIDISAEQLARAQRYCAQQGDQNVRFKEISIYDLATLKEKFDLIYCRFVLHHLHSPRTAISIFYQHLNDKGIYLAEEGIISAAFAYPPTAAWHYSRPEQPLPEMEVDGQQRDGEFGMKLIYWMQKKGFAIRDACLVQPLLTSQQQKTLLLDGHYAYKKTALAQGMSNEDWEAQTLELKRLAADELSIVGFYQSCLVCGVK